MLVRFGILYIMVKHNKLVRDKIPDIIAQNEQSADVRILESDDEFVLELQKKLVEEAEEIRRDPSVEEIADLMEVAEALMRVLGISREELVKVKKEKVKSNGSFNDRVFLISVEE